MRHTLTLTATIEVSYGLDRDDTGPVIVDWSVDADDLLLGGKPFGRINEARILDAIEEECRDRRIEGELP